MNNTTNIYILKLKKNKYYTHLEIDPSLILGVMVNLVIYPEYNPITRSSFSCGQSKQAVSLYHSNYQMRIDKMGVVLNNGQIPLIKSRYMEYINNEEQPYGVNAIVAIMSYTGYNVEDAILINEGAIARGIFRTTYHSMYESREESSKISKTSINSVFTDVLNSSKKIVGTKSGFDYSHLDQYGMIRENTPVDDKTILIGQVASSINEPDLGTDNSVKPKKGQLGFVDKTFITESEEGTRLAKVRIREERMPSIGDKFASRAGQKGTVGVLIREQDMPFTGDGIRPDIIINPHAIPSRMTIGQLKETLLGKVLVQLGLFGDGTSFGELSVNDIRKELIKVGYEAQGNELLYNGMTGEQIESNIFIGPAFYQRLKHMVNDKQHSRSIGPMVNLTRQPAEGRSRDGGLRFGEMERDCFSVGTPISLNSGLSINIEEMEKS